MKLLGEGGTPKPLVMSGELKSSISLFRRIPVEPDMTLEPKLEHTVIYSICMSINKGAVGEIKELLYILVSLKV